MYPIPSHLIPSPAPSDVTIMCVNPVHVPLRHCIEVLKVLNDEAGPSNMGR